MKSFVFAMLLAMAIIISVTLYRTNPIDIAPEGYVAHSFSLKNNMGSIELFVPQNMSHFREEIDLSDNPPDDAIIYTFTDTTLGSYKAHGFFDDYVGEHICYLEFRQLSDSISNISLSKNLHAYTFEEKIEYASSSISPCPLYLAYDTMHVDGHIFRCSETIEFDSAQFPNKIFFEWKGYTILQNQLFEINLKTCGPNDTDHMERGINAIRSIRFHPE